MHKVGGQEFANEIPRLKTFLDEATKLATRVRDKMKAQGYERLPFDLASTDVAPLIRQMMTVKLVQHRDLRVEPLCYDEALVSITHPFGTQPALTTRAFFRPFHFPVRFARGWLILGCV